MQKGAPLAALVWAANGETQLHVGVVGTTAPFRSYPGNVLGWIFDIAGLAVHAVLEVDLKARLALIIFDDFVHPGRAVALCGLGVFGQVLMNR